MRNAILDNKNEDIGLKIEQNKETTKKELSIKSHVKWAF
jgi:hypothetical protein